MQVRAWDITGHKRRCAVVLWRIAPPLTVSTDEIDRAVDILDKSLRDSLDEMAIAGRA